MHTPSLACKKLKRCRVRVRSCAERCSFVRSFVRLASRARASCRKRATNLHVAAGSKLRMYACLEQCYSCSPASSLGKRLRASYACSRGRYKRDSRKHFRAARRTIEQSRWQGRNPDRDMHDHGTLRNDA